MHILLFHRMCEIPQNGGLEVRRLGIQVNIQKILLIVLISFWETVNTSIPGISTGTATIPVDALNSSAIQPYGYFPQFVPKVATEQKQQTWYGNLKKYFAVNGSLYGTKSGAQPVMQSDEIKML